MTTYTYDTNADEDAALDIELMKINGQLASQNQKSVDLQGMFTLFVAEKLKPMTMQTLQMRLTPLIQKFIDSPEETRQALELAVATLPVIQAEIKGQ